MLKKLCVDSGATQNNFLMQFQADILNVIIERPINNVGDGAILYKLYVTSLKARLHPFCVNDYSPPRQYTGRLDL